MAQNEKMLDHVRRTRLRLTYLELNDTFDTIYNGDDQDAKMELLDKCQGLYDDLNKYDIHLSASKGVPSMGEITESPANWY